MIDGVSVRRLPRCCPRHDDWRSIAAHLTREFTGLPALEVAREVARAREATELVALDPPDALFIGELIARHQLMIRTGRVSEVARLDPESHTARSRVDV